MASEEHCGGEAEKPGLMELPRSQKARLQEAALELGLEGRRPSCISPLLPLEICCHLYHPHHIFFCGRSSPTA